MENFKEHEHCFHVYGGAIHMVVPDGHVIQKCCKCPKMRTVHVEHLQHRKKDNHKSWQIG